MCRNKTQVCETKSKADKPKNFTGCMSANYFQLSLYENLYQASTYDN